MINNAQIVDMVAYRRHAHGRSFVSATLCVLLLSFCCLSLDGASVSLYANYLCYANGEFVKTSNFSTRFTFNKERTSDIVSPAGKTDAYNTTNMPSLFPRTYTTRIPDGYVLSNPNWVIVDEWVFNNAQIINAQMLPFTDLETTHFYMKYNDGRSVVTVNRLDLFGVGKPSGSFAYIAPCFEWLKYKLYYDMNIPNHLGPDLTEEYIYTNTVHLTTSTNDWTRKYYTLEGLSLSSNATEATYQFGQTITSAGSRFNATTNGVTLYAVWKPREITMTLDAGEGTVSPLSFVLTGEDKCPALPDAVREGYTFEGWFIGDSRIVQDDTIDDMTNITLTARYTINTYDITFDENYEGGAFLVTNIEYGTEMPVPPPPERSGWSFMGWEPMPDVTVPASNVYYRATWVVDVWHDATFAWQNDDGETNVVVSVREGDYAEVPGDVNANELAGRSFVRWEPDPGGTQVTSDGIVFTAQYTNNIYTVAFDANGGGGGLVTNLEYNAAIPSAPEVAREGWSFVAWEPKPESVGTVPASNVTFTAQWSEDIFYNADFIYYDGSVVVTNKTRVKESDCATVPNDLNLDARIGYSFTGWNPPDPANTTIISNTVFVAQYTNNVYEVVFDANGGEGGLVTNLEYGAAIPSAPTVTREGSSFVAWEPEPAGTVPASNVCYVAQYTNNIYEVVFDAGYEGGVRVVTNLEFGAEMPQPPAVAREGFVFKGWLPSVPATVPPSNVCYVAQWTEEKITYGDLATAADANFELTRQMENSKGSWTVSTDNYFKGVSSIKAEMHKADNGANIGYSICITGVVHGVGSISFWAKSSEELQYQDGSGSKRGLRFGYGTNPSIPGKWISPEPLTTNNEWKEFTIQIGENVSDVTVVWWYVYQDVEAVEGDEPIPRPEFNIWLDDIKWTPATGPTEADRPVVSGFSAASGGGFMLSISNASPSFDYVVQTNTTLRTDAVWGEMKRVSGDQAGSIELERPAGVPSLFYRVGVEAK
ncbi:MAG: InlB B-repeat-containing protein [Kiritimatiellae bacterium]|nr:InlB B-repeat-containing protein [Kiritimatiellia bacterium]